MREEHQMDKNTQQLENIASGSPYINIAGTLGQRSKTQKQSKSCLGLGNAQQPFKRIFVLCRLRKKNDFADTLQ